MVVIRAIVTLVLLVLGVIATAWAAQAVVRMAWRTDEVVPRMLVNRAAHNGYQTAVRLTSEQTGAPEWYVRRTVPAPVYVEPCVRVVTNPLLWVNRIGGFVGGSLMTLIPVTAPFGVATLAAAGSIEAALPPTVVRKCR